MTFFGDLKIKSGTINMEFVRQGSTEFLALGRSLKDLINSVN